MLSNVCVCMSIKSIHLCVYIDTYIYIEYTLIHVQIDSMRMHTFMGLFLACVCMWVYAYMYTHIHIHMYGS